MRISYREAANDSLIGLNTPDESRQQDSGNPMQTKIPRHVIKLKLDPNRKEMALDKFIPLGQQNLMQNPINQNTGTKETKNARQETISRTS